MKEIAMIQLSNENVRKAEIHWYEARGIGRKEFKRKGYLEFHYRTFRNWDADER
jgi:hypothetical protein